MRAIPKPLADLLNAAEPGFVVFAFAHPTRALRVSASVDFCTFRVERLILHNKDVMNPRGAWHTISSLTAEQPGARMNEAMSRLLQEQIAFHRKRQRRMSQ